VLLIGLSFLDCSQTALAITLLTVAVSLSGCVFSGYFVNHIDIAPQYAGTLMGISNCVAASSGFIAPYVTSVLTIAVSLSTLLLLILLGNNLISLSSRLPYRYRSHACHCYKYVFTSTSLIFEIFEIFLTV